MNICIIGAGYVGLVSGACFADLGNTVICVDNDEKKVKSLSSGLVPIYEPGLEELIKRNRKEGRLSFGSNIKDGVRKSEVIFIAVGTPSRDNGEADLTFVENVCREIAFSMPSYRLIVEKSTVPVNTGEWVEHTIKIFKKKKRFDVVILDLNMPKMSGKETFIKLKKIDPNVRVVISTGYGDRVIDARLIIYYIPPYL